VKPADRADARSLLGDMPSEATLTVARNVSTRYLAIAIEALLGFLVLPFNVAHLGASAYGLWMLTASITAYFSVLDLGYGGALVKFVAQYRTRRDARALNEILSTTFFLFAVFGALTYVVAMVCAVYLDRLFQLTPDQVHTGRIVLLIVTLNVASGTAFSVFGAVINGFQRYDLNNIVGAISSIVAALVNVMVLLLGYGLVELVAATTAVRVVTYGIYRANAYRVFPGLQIRASLFRRARLREVTVFSVYMGLIDWATKLNYSVDAIVIGAFINTSAVAVWTVGQRLAEVTQRLSNQLNEVLFPAVVDNDTADRLGSLRTIFIQGSRLSLVTVVPMGVGLIVMAPQLVHAWVGSEFDASIIVVQLLVVSVIVRVGSNTASTLLKGAGHHRLLAVTNVTTAICNLALSIAFVKPLALTGVAVGTLLPVVVFSSFVIFPAACRRVELPIREAVASAVWPAIWPAAVMVLYLESTKQLVADSLLAIAANLLVGALVYATAFLVFGIGAKERRFYLSKLGELFARMRLRTASESI
jgi:O-antigen/teichoic acid export membrane protein